MKPILITTLLCLIGAFAFSQQLPNDTTFISSKGITIKVKDDLVIGNPSTPTGEFSFIENETKRKFGLLSKIANVATQAGSGAAVIGLGSNSVGAMKAGVNTIGTAQVAGSVGNAGNLLLSGTNKLTGQELRILKFNSSGSEKRGFHYYAIVAGPGNSNYKIDLEPALNTYEVAGINHKLFDKPGNDPIQQASKQ